MVTVIGISILPPAVIPPGIKMVAFPSAVGVQSASFKV